MDFELKTFDDLTPLELYEALRLRSEVFVVEQNCVYQDMDDKDKAGYHVLGKDEKGTIRAYTRILPRGVSYADYVSIGRVVNSQSVRGKGIGKALMEFSINACRNLFPGVPVKISAQTYLLRFYNELGFKEIGDGYLEDGIPHVAMLYSNNA